MVAARRGWRERGEGRKECNVTVDKGVSIARSRRAASMIRVSHNESHGE